jgi:tripartite-type tricarboxylate transporter receptor subunit TctC
MGLLLPVSIQRFFPEARMRRFFLSIPLCLLSAFAVAQGFPNKAVHIVVPFPPGGGADVVVRVLSPKISEFLGQQVVVENRAGAGSNIGTDYVAKAAADGYTLLVATASTTINQTLAKNKTWDLGRDFAPVVHLVNNQNLMAVHPSVPANNVREFIALAKAKPGTVTYASYGNGTSAHLIAELFKMMAGVDLVHVPYKGAAPAVNDLIGGQVNVIFADIAAILPHAKAGKARPLGVGSPRRFEGLPEVPTVAETVPGFEGGGFLALVAPAGTPRAAIDALNAATVKALAVPEVRSRIIDLATVPVGGSPDQLAQYLRADVDKWAKVIKAGNVKVD